MSDTTRQRATKRKVAASERDPTLAYAYVRVSTDDQAERDLSLPAQERMVRAYAERESLRVERAFIEPGVSARHARRPQLREMVAALLEPTCRVSVVLVYMSSRLMRNVLEARTLKAQLAKVGVRVVSVTQPITADPMGKLMEGIFENFDAFESDITGMRTALGMRELARKGYYPGARAPYGLGFERVVITEKVSRRKLVIEPTEAGRIRELVALFLTRGGALVTAREMNRRGLLYRGDRKWTKDLVLRVLGDSAIAGRVLWGRTESRERRPTAEGSETVIPVEPILDEQTWNEIQRMRERRAREQPRGRTSSSPMLLAGLVRCGKCSASYTLETSGKERDGTAYAYRYYNCRTFLREGRESCTGYRVPEAELDGQVLGHLADRVFTTARVREIVEDMIRDVGVARSAFGEQRAHIRKQLADVEARMARWNEAFETGQLDAAGFAPRVAELRGQREDLLSTLNKVKELRAPERVLLTDDAIERFRSELRQLLLEGDRHMAKGYLRLLLDEIVITDGEVHVSARRDVAIESLERAQAPGGFTADACSLTFSSTKLRELDSNQ